MKAKDAERVARLVKASEGIDALVKAMRRTKPDPVTANWRGMEIAVGDFDEDGGGPDAFIHIDLTTARQLIPHLLDVIGDELTKLGVDPP